MRRVLVAAFGILFLLPACTGVVIESDASGTTSSAGGGAGGATTGTTSVTGTTTSGPLCAPSGPSGAMPWGRALDSHAFPAKIVVDPAGSPILAGAIQGQAAIGDVVLGTPGMLSDVFLAKLDPCGEVLWAKAFGGPGQQDWFVAFDLDEEGRLVLATSDTVDASTSTVHRLDAAGEELWKRDVHHLLFAQDGVALTADGGLILGGAAWQDVDLGDGPIPGSKGTQVIARFDANGQVVWTAGFEWVGYPGMAVSPQGDIYFWQADSLEGDLLSVTKIDASGAVLWTYSASGNGSLWAQALAADEEGVFLSGAYSDTFDFGFGNPAAPGTAAGYLLRLSADGQPSWADIVLPADPSSRVWGVALAVTGDGGAQIAGSYQGAVDVFGTGTLPPAMSIRPFFARVSKEGSLDWKSAATGALEQAIPYGAAIGPDGRMWVLVSLQGTLDLADGTTITPEPYGVGDALVWINP